MKPRFAFAIIFFSIALESAVGHAQWQPDGAPVCTEAAEQLFPRITGDGFGGAIITWSDLRAGDHYDVYVQRIDASGTPLWTIDGVAVSTAANDQFSPDVAADGGGGAVVVWYDRRSGTNYDIYAQRLNAAGVPQWAANGVPLCTAVGDQYSPELISDGAGGAIVVWDDDRTGGFSPDVYVQRVSASGIPLWTPNGVALVLQAADQAGSRITPDGFGGALVTWHDYRNSNYDVFLQRVNSSGVRHWIVDGVAICLEESDQSYQTVAPDGSGGGMVVWVDVRSGISNVFGQRVNAAGATQWTTDGIAISASPFHQDVPFIVADDAGGAIVSWGDHRGGTSSDIYAQRVSPSGSPLWTPAGVPVCTAAGHQLLPNNVTDGAGGAILAWYDYRNGAPDIFAQRLDASGISQLTPDGEAICTAAGDQINPNIASDGDGGAIVTWQDDRSGIETDIYAQRVSDPPTAVGNAPPMAALTVRPNYPNPFSGTTEMEIRLPSESSIEIDVYDVAGRRVRTQSLASARAGWNKVSFDGRDDGGRLLPSGVYFYRVHANGTLVSRKIVIAR